MDEPVERSSDDERTRREARSDAHVRRAAAERRRRGRLVRVVRRSRTDEVAVDLAGGAFGRGAHVHASTRVHRQGAAGGLARVVQGDGRGSTRRRSARDIVERVRSADRRAARSRRTVARSSRVGADAALRGAREGRRRSSSSRPTRRRRRAHGRGRAMRRGGHAPSRGARRASSAPCSGAASRRGVRGSPRRHREPR